MPEMERAPGVASRRPTTKTIDQIVLSVRHAADIPTVAGVVYAPCRGRSQYLIVMEHCPHCGLAHAPITDRASADAAWLPALGSAVLRRAAHRA